MLDIPVFNTFKQQSICINNDDNNIYNRISKQFYNLYKDKLYARKNELLSILNTNYNTSINDLISIPVRKELTCEQLDRLQVKTLAKIYQQNTKESLMLYNYLVEVLAINYHLWLIEHLVECTIEYEELPFDL